MFGGTEAALFYGIVALSLGGALTDLLRGKIFNWMNLVGLLSGLVASFALGGWAALGSSLLAVFMAFALYGWMFWTGLLGGGDIKFLMALGAWGGPRFVWQVALLALMVGGVLAFLQLLVKGRLPDFSRRMRHFVLTLIVRELEPEMPKIDRSQRMPFGLSIAAAAIWVAAGNPFALLGVNL